MKNREKIVHTSGAIKHILMIKPNMVLHSYSTIGKGCTTMQRKMEVSLAR